jgi:hypothetical protein
MENSLGECPVEVARSVESRNRMSAEIAERAESASSQAGIEFGGTKHNVVATQPRPALLPDIEEGIES